VRFDPTLARGGGGVDRVAIEDVNDSGTHRPDPWLDAGGQEKGEGEKDHEEIQISFLVS
jgi:hypothetical protein